MPGHVPRTRGPVAPAWFGKSANPPDVWADQTNSPGAGTAQAAAPVIVVSPVAPAGTQTAQGVAPTLTVSVSAPAGTSTAQAVGLAPEANITVPAGAATAAATGPGATDGLVAPAGTATATGSAPTVTVSVVSSGGGGPSLREVAARWRQRHASVTVNATAGLGVAHGGSASTTIENEVALTVEDDEFALVELLLA